MFSEGLLTGIQILVNWWTSPLRFLLWTWSLPSILAPQCSPGPVLIKFHSLQNSARHEAIFAIKAHHAQAYSKRQTSDLPFVLSSLPSPDPGPDDTFHWCHVLLLTQSSKSSHFQIWKRGFGTEGDALCKVTCLSRYFEDLDICYHNRSFFKFVLGWLNYKYFSKGFIHVLKTHLPKHKAHSPGTVSYSLGKTLVHVVRSTKRATDGIDSH